MRVYDKNHESVERKWQILTSSYHFESTLGHLSKFLKLFCIMNLKIQN